MRLTEDQRVNVLQEQENIWSSCVEAGRKGDPFATLCLHCYGRHKPPRDEICQRVQSEEKS